MIDAEGQPRIMDFGLARDLSEDQRITIPGKATGTPAFMAPEQVRGDLDAISPQTDIWGLGTTLYFGLSRHYPFMGKRPLDLHQAILQGVPKRLRDLVPDLPPALDDIVGRCLQKQPQHRYADADLLANELQTILDGGTLGAPIRIRLILIIAAVILLIASALLLARFITA
jgi:serine/threonine protein kinase